MKAKLKILLTHFIYSNLLVSLSAGMLTIGVCHQLEISSKIKYGFFTFFSTWFTYTFQRIVKSKQMKGNVSNHIRWVRKYPKVQFIFIALGVCSTIVSFFQLYKFNILSFSLLVFSLSISLGYVIQIKSKSLRDVQFLKIHLITFVWLVAIGIFPLLNEEIYEIKKWLFVWIQSFYLVSIAIAFDIRDIPFDHPNQRTIPQIIGIQKSKIVSLLLFLIYLISISYIRFDLFQNGIFLFTILGTTGLILNINDSRSEFYYSGWMDASILLVGVSFYFI